MSNQKSQKQNHFSKPGRKILAPAAAVAVGLVFTSSAWSQAWLPTAGGTYYWNNSGNWAGGVPNSATAAVNLSSNPKLTGSQYIYEEGQAAQKVSIGDYGQTYQQTLYADGLSQPALKLGSAGVTSTVYVNSPIETPGVNFTFKTAIAAPLDLQQGNLQVISNDVTGTTNQNFNAIDLASISNGASLEISHVYLEDGSYSGTSLSYSGSTTLDGGYSTLAPGGISLPSTTTVVLSDPTDLLELAGSVQTIGTISGTGLINLGQNTGGYLATTANGTTFSGSLFGNGTLHVNGGGTLTLTGNSFTAVRNLSAFTGTIEVGPTGFNFVNGLSVNSDVALGAPQASLQLQQGTLYTTANMTLLQQLTIPSSYVGTLSPSSGTTLTVSSAIAGGGQLVTSGAGAVVLANSANANGSLRIGGPTQFSTDGDLGTSGGTVYLGATLELLNNNTVTNSRPVTLIQSGAFFVDSGSTLTLQGPLTETPGSNEFPNHVILTASGSGTLVLTNTNNNYSGGTLINGTLSISSDANLGAISYNGGPITFGSHIAPGPFFFPVPGELITNGNVFSNRPVYMGTRGANFAPAASTSLVLEGVVSGGGSTNGSGSLEMTGAGELDLFGANTFTGGVYLGSGTLGVQFDSGLGDASGNVEINGATLNWNYATVSSPRSFIIDNGGANVGVTLANTVTLAGPISGTGALNKIGFGTLNLTSGSNNFSGGTVVSAGILGVGPVTASTSNPLGSGPVTLAGGTLLLHGSGASAINFQQVLNVTGFNQDVVVERTATTANVGAAVTTAFDAYPSTSTGFAFYENGYNGASGGLPQVHTFISGTGSGVVSFNLQSYNGSNVLLCPGSGSNGQLVLSTPGRFTTVSFLAAAANGNASATVTLNFADGTSYSIPQTINDWYTHLTAALGANNRVSLSNGSVDTSNPGYPRLFEYDISVPTADANEIITSVGFTDNSSATLGVFALSGNGALLGSAQTYSNVVNVTQNSYINVDGSPNATMGALTIGSNLLAIQGPSGGSLSFPSASVTGNASFDVSNGFTLNLGTVSGGGSITSTDTGTITYSANGGTLSFLNVSTGKVTLLSSRSHLVVGGLSFGGTPANPIGLLDLRDNDLIVQNGSLADINAEIKKAFNGGSWAGSSGITSSSASFPNDPSHLHALGVLLNSSNIYNASHPFDGYATATTDVLVKYTYYGDTNLDGKVDGSDYSRIDAAFSGNKTNPGKFSGWFNGDFNYDGAIDGSDYTLIDNAFNRQGAQLTSEVAQSTAQISASTAAVPEPAGGLLCILAVSPFLRRRISCLSRR